MARGRADQLTLALGPYENRRLFADHFLTEVFPGWPEFQTAPADALLRDLAELWTREAGTLRNANEAQTEERFIKPVLERLGFAFNVQASLDVAGRRRQPDYALFTDDAIRATAAVGEGAARYRGAVAVCDAKKFDRPLDSRRAEGALTEDPVAQIIHYVAVTRCRWGVLTNGRMWRLYAAEGDLVDGACLEFDLVRLLEAGDVEPFRWFAALFTADAFHAGPDGRALIDRVLDGSRAQAVAVGDQLQRQVFAAVPLLAEGLLGEEPRTEQSLRLAFDHALVLLYRLLFCLNAEDRGLLPVDNEHYRSYSLRRQRDQLAAALDGGRVFSSRSDDLYNDLRALFRIVDKGDPALGVNEYNGGLFSATAHPWLHDRWVPDDRTARALDLLYRVGGQQVDYKDLAVRHLGTIFEQLLAYELQDLGEDRLGLAPAPGRKATGAWFTPDHIVDEIVARTLEPLVDERSRTVEQSAMSGRQALEALLDLRVLDPAMGSGHFLVGAAAYIARRIANDPSYDGELSLSELRGLVAERCLYGVDVNPMAVEVAQLAMWLSTLRQDRPLRFLGNLRDGNSLVGAELRSLLEGGTSIFADELSVRARPMLDQVGRIASIDARSGDEAHAKEEIAAQLASARAPLLTACDEVVDPPVTSSAGRPFHWEVEFPEVFLDAEGRLRADGGFDAVIGNPPYVRIQELGRDVAEYCRQHYATAFGSFDAFVPFIEQGLRLLGRKGRLGFIAPTTWIKKEYGSRLRALLGRERLVEEIIDFGHAQVFAAATNYTAIVILDRRGADEIAYTAVRGGADDVRHAIAAGALPLAERYASSDLGSDAWMLAPAAERAVLDAMQRAGTELGGATAAIFTGLQTSADPIYILQYRGRRGGRVFVVDASGRELELEPDLLHPLASGPDVERYALRELESMLLFPYVRDGAAMRLLREDELRGLPLTWSYLESNEETLRGRERGKMDKDGWWAFGRTQSLGHHDRPKLGVAATVKRLEVAADPQGAAFFHNVRVNGILPRDDGPSLGALTAILNCRAVDFAFRRGAAPLQNGFFTANKQFISWLPVPHDLPSEIDALGEQLHDVACRMEQERAGFLDWLGSITHVRVRELSGWTKLAAYADRGTTVVLDVLEANATRLAIDPRARAVRERIETESQSSADRVLTLRRQLSEMERAADDLAYDLYGLTAAQRALLDEEYGG
jgi:type I restriction-modification system DNA methylase subunit